MSTSKLTNEERLTIAELYHKGMYSQRELAALYSVSKTTISRVCGDLEWYFSTKNWETGGPDQLELSGPFEDQSGPVGISTKDQCCDDSEPSLWLAVAALVALAAWVGGALYFAFYN